MNFDDIKLKVQTVFTKEKMSALGSKIKYEMVFIGEKIKEKYNELSVKVKKFMKKD
jgi:hypothetical protein